MINDPWFTCFPFHSRIAGANILWFHCLFVQYSFFVLSLINFACESRKKCSAGENSKTLLLCLRKKKIKLTPTRFLGHVNNDPLAHPPLLAAYTIYNEVPIIQHVSSVGTRTRLQKRACNAEQEHPDRSNNGRTIVLLQRNPWSCRGR